MNRNLEHMARQHYDLLIIGGGIYGATIAWDAQQRGLAVALIEKGDFGHATSANSLKIIHGGLRYLRDANLKVVRMMIKERQAFMRIAPHLVHPMRCLLPANRHLLNSRGVLRAALWANDLFGFDRNKGVDPHKYLPAGELLSEEDSLRLLPGLRGTGVTGAAVWYDGQIHNSERLTLAFIQSAVQAGADVANYVEAQRPLIINSRVVGVEVYDQLSQQIHTLSAKVVVNAAGPGAKQFLGENAHEIPELDYQPTIAMNLVTRQMIQGTAVGLPNLKKDPNQPQLTRTIFITPWRNYSLIGTAHIMPHKGQTQPTEQDINRFLAEINASYPPAALKREDILLVQSGILPARPTPKNIDLIRESLIIDHSKKSKLEGMITVVGVKYTMARYTAEKTVDCVLRKLNLPHRASMTIHTPLYNGRITHFTQFLAHAIATRPSYIPIPVIERLVYNYGSQYEQVLQLMCEEPDYRQPLSQSTAVTKAEIIHAIRHEMAIKLDDVVYRRTDLGLASSPDVSTLEACTTTMAEILGWSRAPRLHPVKTMFIG